MSNNYSTNRTKGGFFLDTTWGTTNVLLVISAVISIPLNIVFIYAAIKNRKRPPFDSSFFTLAVSLAIADLFCMIHAYIFIHPGDWGILNEALTAGGGCGTLLGYIADAPAWFMPVNQYFGTLLIGINRVTAVFFTVQYETFWSRIKYYAIAVQWAISGIMAIGLTFTPHAYSYWGTGYFSVSVIFCDFNAMVKVIMFGMFFNGMITIITALLYIVTLTKIALVLRKRSVSPAQAVTRNFQTTNGATIAPVETVKSRQNPPQSLKKMRNVFGKTFQQNVRNTIGGFLMFLAMLLLYSFGVTRIFFDIDNGAILYYFGSQLMSSANILALLLTSPKVRQLMRETVIMKTNRK